MFRHRQLLFQTEMFHLRKLALYKPEVNFLITYFRNLTPTHGFIHFTPFIISLKVIVLIPLFMFYLTMLLAVRIVQQGMTGIIELDMTPVLEKVPIKRRVRQGDLLSELLFDLVMNEIIKKLRIKCDAEWGIRK